MILISIWLLVIVWFILVMHLSPKNVHYRISRNRIKSLNKVRAINSRRALTKRKN